MSYYVQKAVDAGWTPVLDGDGAVAWFTHDLHGGKGRYKVLDVLVKEHQIQVSVSPTGRSVQIYVDGERVT